MRTTIRAITTAAAVAASAAALAACGGASGDDGTATSAADPDAARLAWAQCMRENGVDVPDPEPGGGGGVRITGRDPAAMERAQEACKDLREAAMPELSPEERSELQDQALAFARCMREQGIDMPDPEVGGGGIRLAFKKGSGGGPGSPAFDRAQEACADLQPRRPGG